MINWRFTILDRNNIPHVTEEPVGWDAMSTEIKRDLETHGIFFDYQGNDFLFFGAAAKLLKDEKEAYGIDGIATLIIEYSCGTGYVELYRGRFLFGKYSFTAGDECFVRIPIETSGDVMELRNRFDQPVNLESRKGFDEVTNLDDYDGLGNIINLPSKGVYIQDYSVSNETKSKSFIGIEPFIPDNGAPINTVIGTKQYTLGLAGENISEIGSFVVDAQLQEKDHDTVHGIIFNDCVYSPLQTNPIINYSPDTPNYGNVSNPVDVSFRITGRLNVITCGIQRAGIGFFRLPFRDNADNGESESDYNLLGSHLIHYNGGDFANDLQPGQYADFDFVFNDDVDFNPRDRFYLIISITDRKTAAQQLEVENNGAFGYSITINEGSFFKAEDLSITEPTSCKLFLANEALSRATEAITNNRIKVLSDYFGRTDSMPYLRPMDGCGSLEAITKGLFIRRQESKLTGRPPVFSLSLKQLFEGFDPIHHIGFGIERDPYRPGYNCLRVENWKYFYSNEVVLSCNNVSKIVKDTQESEHYSLFSFGYEKWEAEEYTGLDEILTRRKYRTTLNSVSNELTKLSKFIASGYAIEITRRKGNEDSKDWRYDNDTFIICLKRGVSGLEVEQGQIIDPENIVDPDSLYNYRITPLRNAMRWFDKISSGFTQPGKIIFTDGDGNFWAKGKYSGECALELESIAENDSLDASKFNTMEAPLPILGPERITFEHELSASDFKKIQDNPYGLIAYNNDVECGFGWIDSVSAKHHDGMGIFKLIPRINDGAGCIGVTAGDLTPNFTGATTPFYGEIQLSGTGPFTIDSISKSTWINRVEVVGDKIVIEGDPGGLEGDAFVSMTARNCTASSIIINETITVYP